MFPFVSIDVPETLGSYIIKWAKNVHEVDMDHSNGYAFRGDWLKVGYQNQVRLHDLILCVSHAYTFGVRAPAAFVFEAWKEGELILTLEAYGWDWANQIKTPLYDYIMT